ncbi:MAG: heme o synthase [Chloroflexota bacterium]
MTSSSMDIQKIQAFTLRNWLLASLITTFILVIVGGMQRVSGSVIGCPDWPTCYGNLLPALSAETLLDFAHRALAAISGLLVLISTYLAWTQFQKYSLLKWSLAAASSLIVAQAYMGGMLAINQSLPETGAFHFGLAILILGLLTVPTVLIFQLNYDSTDDLAVKFNSPFERLSIGAIVAIFIILVSGVMISNNGSAFVCAGWPLCNGELVPQSPLAWSNFTHRILVAVGAVYMLYLFNQVWRTHRTQRAVLTSATMTVVVYFAQGCVGAIEALRQFPVYILGLHEATAAALMVSAVILLIYSGLSNHTAEDEKVEAAVSFDHKQRVKDFMALTKPIIVLLLLFTTLSGMFVGARAWPAWDLVIWTMIGGALAAGGSGAVNHYIDREIDKKMTRTAKRPLASGRLTPAEGLAFGAALLLISFYLLAGFVNMLAALLSLAGMIYYVIIYSLLLKKTTIQNIVIGGGAGAIPPMVGIAATTGQIGITAVFLFAIIFMWTPPHFWALALVRKKEYAEAGIPMLPVVKGEEETRRQILIYTIELVALTLLMGLLQSTGYFYLAAAVLLGAWMLALAWQVWRLGGNKVAYKMYRQSSYYLFFIFIALAVDALL